MIVMKKLRFLEWLWIAQAMLSLIALLCLAASNSIIFLVLSESLGFPLGWLIKGSDVYSFLPTSIQYVVSYIIIVANGGLFYAVLRFCFRRKAQTDPSQTNASNARPEQSKGFEPE